MRAVTSLLQRLRALPAAARTGGLIALLALAGASVAFGVVAHPARAPLFATALHPEQLAEVQEQLAAWNVTFTPSADNVVVDAARRNDLLLRLSLAGVPHAHVQTSDEALATVGVLTPQSVIDAQTRSGLAGDIEVALRSIDGVDDAHVIVAPAQSDAFADEHPRSATASVRLRLHAGASLSRDAVDGIRRFVAASVAGLDAASVTILDDRGIALGDASGDQDAIDVQHSLQSALDAAFGAGVTIARVHVEYTTAASEERETRREALSGGAIDRTAQNESYSGEGKRYAKDAEHDDRGSDTRERVVRADPGAVARTSTAVLVDAARGADLVAIREVAAATVGYDPRRGDTLGVAAVDFHHTLVPKRDAWMLAYGALAPLMPTIAVLIAAAFAIRAGVPPLCALLAKAVERDATERAVRSVSGYEPAGVRSALAGEPPHAAAAIISALPAATAAAVLELYPPHEREAIVRRMQRTHASVVPNLDDVFGRHA